MDRIDSEMVTSVDDRDNVLGMLEIFDQHSDVPERLGEVEFGIDFRAEVFHCFKRGSLANGF